VDLIIGKHLKFRANLGCLKKRPFANTRKGEALFIEITQDNI
jgi:hypothetical protein